MDHGDAKGSWTRQLLNEHNTNMSMNIPIIELSRASSLTRSIFDEDNEGNTVRPNKGPRLFLGLKVNDESSMILAWRIFHLDNVNLVTCCVIVHKYLCICNRRGWGEVEGDIQLIRVLLVLEWERGRLVEGDPHQVVGTADFTSEDTRLWLNDIERDVYGLYIILARYLRKIWVFEWTLKVLSAYSSSNCQPARRNFDWETWSDCWSIRGTRHRAGRLTVRRGTLTPMQ